MKLEFKHNKFLGQNFLKSKKIIDEIIKTADIEGEDVVLEAGPGKGILTEELIKKAKKVIVVEKDRRLVECLQERFKNARNLEIIHGDILKFQTPIPPGRDKYQNYKIVANIPYYITSRFFRKFLQSDFQPSKMVLMVQKEVAERIVSKKESILSISIKSYGLPKIIKKVPASYFLPKPKVDSAILLIDKISKEFFKNINEASFFNLLKKGFSSRRKMLKNNLKLLNTERLIICGIAKKARPEDLSPEKWKCLFLIK